MHLPAAVKHHFRYQNTQKRGYPMQKLKRWQIPLFAFAHFGPCMLSTIISVYLVDALQTAGFGANVEQWTFASKNREKSLYSLGRSSIK